MLKRLTKTNISPAALDLSLLILRLGSGGMMLTHGIPKLMRLAEGNMKFSDPIGLGPELSLIATVFSEVICALLIVFGFWTRIGAFFLGFTMFVAAFIRHLEDPFGQKEKALLYFVMYLVLWIAGSGKYSLDKKLFN